MEVERLVPKPISDESHGGTWAELSRVNWIALPMIVVTVSQFLLRVSPMFMLGHVDQLSLSSASIATSLCNVTGFSVVFGMASALETLCGQAYGAKQYKRVGSLTYGAILCLFLVCIPLSLLFILTEKLLSSTGQDPSISSAAGKFAIQLIPTLFPYAFLQCLVRYLQIQSLIFPMVWSSLASLCFQLPLCWAFIFKFNLGNNGAAISIGISSWFNVVLLLVYVMYSPACQETRPPFSMDVLHTMREFLHLAIPSAAMVCLEWWSFEVILLLSGVLPNPQLETSVLSICFTISYLHYHVPYSFGAAASTLISNEMGAGKADAARATLHAVLGVAIIEFLVASLAIVCSSSVLGYAFSRDKQLIHYVKEMAPLLGISIIMDGLQAVLSGVVRGIGLQHIGAYVNLGAYYLVCIPVALFFAFLLHLKGQGLWSGLVAGATVQSISLSLLTAFTNWENQAIKARQRIFSEEFAVGNESACKHEKSLHTLKMNPLVLVESPPLTRE
ncbi:MATE efflux family protein [Perilla frutescens var. hirtella]|uniref:Protein DETOXIFICATION n=1 Tax=Perilla frutescens var. hirtella TaxID=608512 RepID=A0AAD4ILD9_PERFH|nr:MATE efflux family protein [Perilla frutescens var. hirtella]